MALTTPSVTGGAGALGSAVVEAVLESGGDVVCLDVVDAPAEGQWSDHVHQIHSEELGADKNRVVELHC